jgi:hypothetical protein
MRLTQKQRRVCMSCVAFAVGWCCSAALMQSTRGSELRRQMEISSATHQKPSPATPFAVTPPARLAPPSPPRSPTAHHASPLLVA